MTINQLPVMDNVAEKKEHIQAFTFGDPETVLNKRAAILDLIQCQWNGKYYAPPIEMDGLTRAYNATPHHQSAINLKRDLLTASFKPNALLSRKEFSGIALDYLVTGNAYLESIPNRLGGVAHYKRTPAKYMRRGRENIYYQVMAAHNDHIFNDGVIEHLYDLSLDQEFYGVPTYVAALQSAFLNENATLFRRKYYLNGSHAGFILHMDGQFSDKDVEGVREALKGSKGPGNFRNLMLQSTGGTKDSVKLIPISEVAAKDEFLGIKNTTRDDVLAAHRTPPQILGVVPTNAGGFGNMTEAVESFISLVIDPLRMQMIELNETTGREIIAFETKEDALIQATRPR